MKTARTARGQNGLGLVFLRKRIGWAGWLPALFLLATAAAAGAGTNGDFTYAINQDSTITITGYIGPGGAAIIPAAIESKPVASIWPYAFRDCTSLTSVTIPASVTSIGNDVFNGCASLTNVMIGAGVTSIGNSAFWNCTTLTAIAVDAGNAVYSSLDGALFNKGRTTLIQCPGGKAGSYTIPATVTSIGNFAFDACYGLTGVTIPASVTSVGMGAFYRCGLTSVTIPASITRIEMDTFRECTSLTNVTIPAGITSIGESAFESCNSLTGVAIPASVTSIGNGAFSMCAYLSAITVDAGNAAYSSLDGILFNKSQTTLIQCPGGKAGSYTIPATVTNLEDNAFDYCEHLTSVTIGSSVTSIGNDFLGCTRLTGVTIPASVTSIGAWAFWRCTSLTTFTVDAGNAVYSSLDGALFNKSQTTLIQCPDGKAGSFTIPATATSIGERAFDGCLGLAGVTVPNSVFLIEEAAFYYCTNLAGVYFWGNAPSLGSDDVFEGATNATVYYLAGTTGWGTTFGGRPTAVWIPPTGPQIKANGATAAVTVNHPAPVSITVEMYAGNYAGIGVDWWVVAYARAGQWYYLDSAFQWQLFNGDLAACQPVSQGGLANVAATPVLRNYVLPRGTYDFWFAVDYPPDGLLNPNGDILFDKVTVVVQ